MSELLKKATERVAELQKTAREISDAEVLLKRIGEMEMTMSKGNETAIIRGLLTDDQMEIIKNITLSYAKGNMDEEYSKLKVLLGENHEKEEKKVEEVKEKYIPKKKGAPKTVNIKI